MQRLQGALRGLPREAGRREDGSWRCQRWGEAQEKKAEELRRTERDRMQTAVMERYTRENRYRFTKGK